jgi:hypothetical protein
MVEDIKVKMKAEKKGIEENTSEHALKNHGTMKGYPQTLKKLMILQSFLWTNV